LYCLARSQSVNVNHPPGLLHSRMPFLCLWPPPSPASHTLPYPAHAAPAHAADSVMIALYGPLLRNPSFNLVVSGINRGDNCGLHVIYRQGGAVRMWPGGGGRGEEPVVWQANRALAGRCREQCLQPSAVMCRALQVIDCHHLRAC